MIKLVTNDGDMIFILEPGNITKIQMGEPLSINLHELGIKGHVYVAWTPDVPGMAIDLANEKAKNKCITTTRLNELLKKALDRDPLDRVAN
jgi:hypothetical protein